MLRLPWNIAEPGHFETDLVHHCGPTTSGEYAYTLQMIDVATGWSERRAVLGRSYLVMEDAFLCFLVRLPFPVCQIHPDNGGEFLNHHMLRFWGNIVQGVTLSRSRPFHKNDNPRVEQKNATLVRAYLGYDRIDSVAQVLALNTLYDKNVRTISKGAEKLLMEYPWEGNVRELKNTIKSIFATKETNTITANDLIFTLKITEDQVTRRFQPLKDHEQTYIKHVLRANNFNIKKTSEILGISRSRLYRKIVDLDIKTSAQN